MCPTQSNMPARLQEALRPMFGTVLNKYTVDEIIAIIMYTLENDNKKTAGLAMRQQFNGPERTT